jgi:outer membrane protein
MPGPVAVFAVMMLALPLAGCATSAIVMAPDSPDRPWTPATAPDGEIIAGERPPQGQAENKTYVLPSNRQLANIPPRQFDLERRRAYSLPELIDIAQSSNPVTRNAWNDARNAALAAGIVESTFLPRVSAGIVGGYQRFHNSVSALGTTLRSNVTLRGDIEVLSAEWLLFDFGERAAPAGCGQADVRHLQYRIHCCPPAGDLQRELGVLRPCCSACPPGFGYEIAQGR